MCGIVGFLSDQPSLMRDAERVACEMAARIAHRGPDDMGCWSDRAAGIAFAHRRLSILELSSAGHQPMESVDGRFVIVFNGEIYNHLELRGEIESLDGNAAEPWRGGSDTETLLRCIRLWGVEGALEKLVGMFAFAVWDRAERVLCLARDRLGEKPLYYGFVAGAFVFASELRSFASFPGFSGTVDRSSICSLLQFSAVLAPKSIYEGISKLIPGGLLRIDLNSVSAAQMPGVSQYWSLADLANCAESAMFVGGEDEALTHFESLLTRAVRGQMLSDVPLGAFLSGGIDSSTIVALMQAESERPVKTFTIGFGKSDYDEARHAKVVAKHLGTDHHELYVTERDALDAVPHLAEVYDEPFADASQLPTFLVSRMARERVVVVLSGDGGDELLGGYTRHIRGPALWHRFSSIPQSGRRGLAMLLRSLPASGWNGLARVAGSVTPAKWRYANIGDKVHKFAATLCVDSVDDLYVTLLSTWPTCKGIVSDYLAQPARLPQWGRMIETDELERRMMYLDSVAYLPDDILAKVDRAAMSVSLETRVPFLDHRVMEFAWRLPTAMKIRDGRGKWLLNRLLDRHVPAVLTDRPKMGFGVPLADWLRGHLREWAENLLDPHKLNQDGYLKAVPVQNIWSEVKKGRQEYAQKIWNVLMFQAWLERIRSDNGSGR